MAWLNLSLLKSNPPTMAFICPVWGSMARKAPSRIGSWSSETRSSFFSSSIFFILTWITSPSLMRFFRLFPLLFVQAMSLFVNHPVYSLTFILASRLSTDKTTASMISFSSRYGFSQLESIVSPDSSSLKGFSNSSRFSMP